MLSDLILEAVHKEHPWLDKSKLKDPNVSWDEKQAIETRRKTMAHVLKNEHRTLVNKKTDKQVIRPDSYRDHVIQKQEKKIKDIQKTGRIPGPKTIKESQEIQEGLDKLTGNKPPKKGMSDLTKAGLAASGTAAGAFGLTALAKSTGSTLGEKITHNIENIVGNH